MKLSYFADTDTLYVELALGSAVEAEEISDGMVAEYDANGRLLGLEFEHASTRLDVTRIEAVGLPLHSLLAA